MITSLSRAVSGMTAAQAGLYVTGHNMSNAGVSGYTRQRVLQADDAYIRVSGNSLNANKIGLGAKITDINQIRSEFLDKSYRQEASKGSFYGVKMGAIEEIEAIIGELYGDGRLSEVIDGLWKSLQELQTHPDGIETRSMLVSTASKFVNKTNQIAEDLYNYQLNLNEQVVGAVNRINSIASQIEGLNKLIQMAEASGDNANDYRDTRNLLIDELSMYGDLNVTEAATGRVNILFEGKDLIVNGGVSKIGFKYTATGYPFVEPVFTTSDEILPADSSARKLFSNLDTYKTEPKNDNDNGSLKALLIVRGKSPSTHMDSAKDVQNYTIPKLQRELDIFVNKIVKLVNDVFAPVDPLTNKLDTANAPYDMNGQQSGQELFSRISTPRFDPVTGEYTEEDKSRRSTIYTMGNLKINPEILNNYNKIPLSTNEADKADTRFIEKLLEEWKRSDGIYSPSFGQGGIEYNFDSYYKEVITNLGREGQQAKEFVAAQETMLNKLSADRSALSGVSTDEELTGMMKYQHAYNASAKIVSVIDSMIEAVLSLKR